MPPEQAAGGPFPVQLTVPMIQPPPPAAAPRRSGCFRRLCVAAVLMLLLLVAGLALVAFLLTRPHRLTPYAERLMSELTGAAVSIDSAQINRRGELLLSELNFQVPGVPSDMGQLLRIGRLHLQPRLGQLLQGHLGPEAIEHLLIEDGVLQITEDPVGGFFNYERFSPPRATEAVAPPTIESTTGRRSLRLAAPPLTWLKQLPTLELRRAAIHFGHWGPEGYTLLEQMPLEGLISVAPDAHSTYHFRLVERQSAPSEEIPPARLTGRLDLEAGEVNLKIEHYRIDAPPRHLLPRAFRTWWEDLNPTGSVPAFEMQVRQDTAGQLRLQEAALDVENLAITLNFFGLDTEGQALPRLENVHGRITVEGDRVLVQSLQGSAAETAITLSGWHDLGPAGAMHLTLQTEAFQLSSEPEFTRVLGPLVRRFYDRFAPTGQARVDLMLDRSDHQPSPHYHAAIELLDIAACYEKFPYPVTGVTGRIEIRPEGVELRQVTGRGPSGARVQVDGQIERHQPHGGHMRLQIAGTQIPLDAALFDALDPPVREVVQSFLDDTHHQRLLQAGLVNSAHPERQVLAPTTPAALSAPIFDPGGVVPSFQLQLERPLADAPGAPEPEPRISWELDPAGVQILYTHWPYPARITDGRIRMTPAGVTVDAVRFTGLQGGGGRAGGTLDHSPDSKALRPALIFEEVALPLNPLLLWTLPPEQRAWIEPLAAEGQIIAGGRVFQEAGASEVDFHFRGRFEEVTLAPHGGRFPILGLQGELELQRGRFQLLETRGRHDPATLSLHGEAHWSNDTSAFDFHIAAERFPVREQALDLLPPALGARQTLGALFDRFRPSGEFDAELHWTGGSAAPDHFRLTARPQTLAFDLQDQRIDLTPQDGVIQIEPGEVLFKAVRAGFPQGRGQLDGQLQWPTHGQADGLSAVDLQFSAQTSTASPLLWLLLPDPAATALRSLQVRGPFDILSGRFQQHTEQQRTEVQALVALKGLTAEIGLDVRDLHGHLAIAAEDQTAAAPQWRLGLAASELKVTGRRIAPLGLSLHTTALADVLALEDLRGSVYGGTLVGSGLIDTREQTGRYRVDLSLVDAAFEPIVDPSLAPNHALAWPTAAVAEARRRGETIDPTLFSPPLPASERGGHGLMSASLQMEGSLEAATDRRGRGSLQIRDTPLIHRPLSLAVAQAANLVLPTARSFDRASARYLLEGNTVYLDLISFDAPTFALSGDGQMRLPSTQIDLRMVTRSPAGPKLGVFGRAFRAIKDELITVQVTGTLDAPRANVTSLGRVRRAWSSLFDILEPEHP